MNCYCRSNFVKLSWLLDRLQTSFILYLIKSHTFHIHIHTHVICILSTPFFLPIVGFFIICNVCLISSPSTALWFFRIFRENANKTTKEQNSNKMRYICNLFSSYFGICNINLKICDFALTNCPTSN